MNVCASDTKFGRPRKIVDTEHIATTRRMMADGHTGKDIAKYLSEISKELMGELVPIIYQVLHATE